MQIIYDDFYLKHDTGPLHCENARRLSGIVEAVRKSGHLRRMHFVSPSPSSLDSVCLVHTREYIEYIKEISGSGIACNIDPDTVVSGHTYDCALLAAGGCINGIDYISSSSINNGAIVNNSIKNNYMGNGNMKDSPYSERKVFLALVRPPGHHAFSDEGTGFCIFNNISIAARYALKKGIAGKIAIIDFDVHHGNGTQSIFYDDDKVFYISLHQYPHYPGTGYYTDTGTGKGQGFTLNIPLSPGSGEPDYIYAFEKIISPLLLNFGPELVLISAGYDAHRLDLLSSINLEDDSFRKIMLILIGLFDKRIPFGLVLEGGYNRGAAAASVLKTIDAFLEEGSCNNRSEVSTLLKTNTSIEKHENVTGIVNRGVFEGIKSVFNI